jgi:hypothetical protein
VKVDPQSYRVRQWWKMPTLDNSSSIAGGRPSASVLLQGLTN